MPKKAPWFKVTVFKRDGTNLVEKFGGRRRTFKPETAIVGVIGNARIRASDEIHVVNEAGSKVLVFSTRIVKVPTLVTA